jgi:hypothetical protein
VKFLLTAVSVLSLALLATRSLAADAPQPEEGFVSLFDGKTLDGWKVGENANLFRVHKGIIVMECPATTHAPAHLFYEGEVGQHDFKNFVFKVDVMTFPGANSGIFFHSKYQEGGWPDFGMESQIDNSHVDWRRTGSIWGIKNVTWGPETPPKDNKEAVTVFRKPPVTDKAWFTEEVIYQDGLVTVKLNGKTVNEYKIPQADVEHEIANKKTWLPRGTFALQAHPPAPGQISKAYFKNVRVKVLPD